MKFDKNDNRITVNVCVLKSVILGSEGQKASPYNLEFVEPSVRVAILRRARP